MPSICKGSCIVEKVSPNIEYVFKCNDKEISVNCLNKDLDKCNPSSAQLAYCRTATV